jgi:hypothetical protein
VSGTKITPRSPTATMLSDDILERPRRSLSCSFCFTWPKEQNGVRLAKLTNDIVVGISPLSLEACPAHYRMRCLLRHTGSQDLSKALSATRVPRLFR